MTERYLKNMQRNHDYLLQQEFDLIIIGGGIFGICAGWDAVLRGLSVALVEKGDFAQAASNNNFKMAHGGVRYLQHADFYRVYHSSRERAILLKIAPHLVNPLPIVVPTYGHGKNGKQILGLGMFAYDLITIGKNRGITDKERRIPNTRFLSQERVLELFPHLKKDGLTGGVIFSDGQMYSPPRLAISFLRSAFEAGLKAVNYTEVRGFLKENNKIVGIKARDRLDNKDIVVRGKVTINAAGPWAEEIFKEDFGKEIKPRGKFSRDVFLVIQKKLTEKYTLALPAKTRDEDALFSRGKRHLFMVPWGDHTLLGVWHGVHEESPDLCQVTREEVQKYLGEVNDAYPGLSLRIEDVGLSTCGLILYGADAEGETKFSFGKRSWLVDHVKMHGIQGLITLIGVRYTTARGDAVKAVDIVFRKLGKKVQKSKTHKIPLFGGNIENFTCFEAEVIQEYSKKIKPVILKKLLRNYGSQFSRILEYIKNSSVSDSTVENTNILKAEVIHAVREEMALDLSDVVLRRTELGSGGYPGEDAIKDCAEIMAKELGWGEEKIKSQIEKIRDIFRINNALVPALK